MDARENALRTIRFDLPERVVSAPPVFEIHYHGCHHRGFGEQGGHDSPVGSRWVDIWGTGWQKVQDGVMGMPTVFPLAGVDHLKAYTWPDPDDDRICGRIYQMAESFPGGDRFLGGSHRNALWEKAYKLVGMENSIVYLFTEPGFMKEVFHRIMDFQMGIAEHYIRAGIEFVTLSEDLGTQRGSLFSPQIVDEFLVPEYERLFALYREHKVLTKVHSCGNIESLLEMFMNLGVDILNPVQASANDLNKVRDVTNGRMALQGAVSSATIMEGPADRIVEEVRTRIWELGQIGGYFCGPDQGLPFPEVHIDAVHKAIEEHGLYPLRPPINKLVVQRL